MSSREELVKMANSLFNHVEKSRSYLKVWMSTIDDNRKISELSIPGTHDTCACYGGIAAECQSMVLNEQLENGIRFLDIRCRHLKDKFTIHHGPIYQHLNFDDVMGCCRNFLIANPSECIIMSVKEEHDPEENTRTYEETFKSYLEQYSDIVWISNYVPTLNEVRGKIVFLRRFKPDFAEGINVSDWEDNATFTRTKKVTYHVQDEYKVYLTIGGLQNKWNAIENALKKAKIYRKPDELVLNFTSGSTHSAPIDVAKYMNEKLKQWFTDANCDFGFPGWGIIIMDFPDQDLIGKILIKNFDSPDAAISCFTDFRGPISKDARDIAYTMLKGNPYDASRRGQVRWQSPGIRRSIIPMACATTRPPYESEAHLHILGTDLPGSIWHAVRHYSNNARTYVFDKPTYLDEKLELPKGSFFKSIACAGIGDILHILASDNNGNLMHTIRDKDGKFPRGWGNVKNQCGNIGSVHYVACAGVDGDLHVLALTDDDKLWHAIRYTDDWCWNKFKNVEVAGGIGPLHHFACAGLNSDINLHVVGDLHVLAVTNDDKLWHAIRHPDDNWDPWKPAITHTDELLSINGGPIAAIACAILDVWGNLGVVATKGDFSDTLYTERQFHSGKWTDWLGLQGIVGQIGSVNTAACASDEIHQDGIFHILVRKY